MSNEYEQLIEQSARGIFEKIAIGNVARKLSKAKGKGALGGMPPRSEGLGSLWSTEIAKLFEFFIKGKKPIWNQKTPNEKMFEIKQKIRQDKGRELTTIQQQRVLDILDTPDQTATKIRDTSEEELIKRKQPPATGSKRSPEELATIIPNPPANLKQNTPEKQWFLQQLFTGMDWNKTTGRFRNSEGEAVAKMINELGKINTPASIAYSEWMRANEPQIMVQAMRSAEQTMLSHSEQQQIEERDEGPRVEEVEERDEGPRVEEVETDWMNLPPFEKQMGDIAPTFPGSRTFEEEITAKPGRPYSVGATYDEEPEPTVEITEEPESEYDRAIRLAEEHYGVPEPEPEFEWQEGEPPALAAADRTVAAPLQEESPFQSGPGEKTPVGPLLPGPLSHLEGIPGAKAPNLEQFMQYQPGAMGQSINLQDFLGAVMNRKEQETGVIDNKDPGDKAQVKIIVTIFNPQPKRKTLHKTVSLATLQNIRPYISSIYSKDWKTVPNYISDAVVSQEGFKMIVDFLGLPTSIRGIRIDSIFGESGNTFFSVD